MSLEEKSFWAGCPDGTAGQNLHPAQSARRGREGHRVRRAWSRNFTRRTALAKPVTPSSVSTISIVYVKGHPFFGAICRARRQSHRPGGRFTLDGKDTRWRKKQWPRTTCTAALEGFRQKGFGNRNRHPRPNHGSGGGVELFQSGRRRRLSRQFGGDGHFTPSRTKSELRIDYRAKTDKATPVNLTKPQLFQSRRLR